ncbi:MAG TPA: hypothetical protein VMW71_06945 [Thermoplasmata archaeon]|nr:hypothetical protein [Thermoplasmata archaeon]
MRGLKCRCGFATTANRVRCPRCGKHMKVAYWPNQAHVIAYIRLGLTPEGHEFPMDLLMLEVTDGPKFVCWTDTKLSEGEEVTFVQIENTYICSIKHPIDSVADKDSEVRK